MRRWIAAATLGLALAGGVLSGCGESARPEQVAGAGGTAPAGAPESAPPGAGDPAKFTKCLREQGLDVKDPAPGSGEITLPDPGPAVEAALDKCKQYDSGTRGSTGFDPNDPKQQERNRQFAKCMRDEGIDWADPVPGKPLEMTKPSPQMLAAMETCSQKFPMEGGR
ncbi:hypothetical protein Asp14428_05770 [Actinoplanes sp. NBRC 14428]|uniref:Uncharacterized protein n=1 Tax=Pseudosporangium ferrugineum TaxID=439699 RepID=A0A2T0SHN6_9ACTN|nr:hypothetical protein [Pseudosporangium ferrugineum]PRY32935.1 hypothetical protein CLV70_10194 [Pseudosporangium ferrugineum]BCJ49102.1 hypothetical protein Asp14428_05770 [Actinoplanes sp. NBRC 14428]